MSYQQHRPDLAGWNDVPTAVISSALQQNTVTAAPSRKRAQRAVDTRLVGGSGVVVTGTHGATPSSMPQTYNNPIANNSDPNFNQQQIYHQQQAAFPYQGYPQHQQQPQTAYQQGYPQQYYAQQQQSIYPADSVEQPTYDHSGFGYVPQ